MDSEGGCVPLVVPLAPVSTQCQFWCKITAAPTKRQCSATVALWKSPFSRPKNAVPGVRKAVLNVDLMLDTQEVTGSSPVSPNHLSRDMSTTCESYTSRRSARKPRKVST